jgi:hypothetical protein
MDNGIRAARDEVAMQRMTQLAAKLAERAGVEPLVLVYERDKPVEAMKHREAKADFLERVVMALPPAKSKKAAKAEAQE